MKKISISFILAVPITTVLVFLYYNFHYAIIYTISSLICEIATIVFLFIPLRYIFSKIKKVAFKIPGTDSYSWRHWIYATLTAAIFIYTLCSPQFIELIDFHKLELEPKGGTYGYYVRAENENGKTYTLEAAVNISLYEIEVSQYDTIIGEYTDNVVYKPGYYISNIYFNNGGYLYFEEPLVFKEPYDSDSSYDQSGKRWKITITDKHIENRVTNVSPLDDNSYIIWALSIFSSVLLLVILCIMHPKISKHNDKIYNNISNLDYQLQKFREAYRNSKDYDSSNPDMQEFNNLILEQILDLQTQIEIERKKLI